MNKASKVYVGTELKLNVNIEPIDSLSMSQYDWRAEVYCTPSKVVAIDKGDAIKIDNNNYVIRIDTAQIGVGVMKCKIIAFLTDNDFNDGTRTEVSIIDTGVTIVKN